jgi:hypothetical protein
LQMPGLDGFRRHRENRHRANAVSRLRDGLRRICD